MTKYIELNVDVEVWDDDWHGYRSETILINKEEFTKIIKEILDGSN